jgi:hypothetical protein
MFRSQQRVLYPRREPIAERDALVEADCLVHAVDTLEVPLVSLVAKPMVNLPETVVTVLRLLANGSLDFRVVFG